MAGFWVTMGTDRIYFFKWKQQRVDFLKTK